MSGAKHHLPYGLSKPPERSGLGVVSPVYPPCSFPLSKQFEDCSEIQHDEVCADITRLSSPSLVLLDQRQWCCRKLPKKIILLSMPLLHLGESLVAHTERNALFFASHHLCN